MDTVPGVPNRLLKQKRNNFVQHTLYEVIRASAAIYGVNAGNGVILITTKKGKEGSLNINYNGNTSILRNYPYLKPLGGAEFMQYFNLFEKDMYLAEHGMQPFGSAAPDYTPKYSQSEINNAGNTDWVEQILRDGSIQNHNVNISGGTQKVSYYVSGGFFDQVGTIENSNMKKYSGSFDIVITSYSIHYTKLYEYQKLWKCMR